VSFFLQGYDDVQSWPYLDKLICAWRQAEEKVREKCGLPPAPAYGRCKLFRGQEQNNDWTGESTIPVNTTAPIEQGTSVPTAVFSAQSQNVSIPTAVSSLNKTASAPSTAPTKIPTSASPKKKSDVPVADDLSSLPSSVPVPSNKQSNSSGQVPSLTSYPPTSSGIGTISSHTCDDQRVDYNRMCVGLDPCCEATRSDSDFCWSVYDTLGSAIVSACHSCCNAPKKVGPPNPEKPGLSKTVQCANVAEIGRMCKPESCCTNPRSNTEFCVTQYNTYGADVEQICHYCCRVPRDVGPGRRLLELPGVSRPKLLVDAFLQSIQRGQTPSSKPALAPTSRPVSIEESLNLTTFPDRNESNETIMAVQEYKSGPTLPPISFSTFLQQLNKPPANTSALQNYAAIDCNDGKVNYDRMCNSMDPCCEDPVSASKFCWESYDILGDAVAAACYQCCDTPKSIGSFPPEKLGLPKTIQCSAIDNPVRMCKLGGCCSSPRSTSTYCQEQYALYNESDLKEICHYCCPNSPSVEPIKRGLRSDIDKQIPEMDPTYIPEGANVVEVGNRRFVVRKENSVPKNYKKMAIEYDALHAAYRRRAQIDPSMMYMEDYLDVDYWPYEAFLKVDTEYYYRYEGTMVVPPCWEVVHWRTFKDPIRLHPRQIDELNRLLAWRLNPDTCQVDTAGKLSEDKNRVEMKRELSHYTTNHRMVFCECEDWPSKFESDKQWCRKWAKDTNYSRFYEHMYSFNSSGQW
jgi:Eukaryotic-type carbonic anhydrase